VFFSGELVMVGIVVDELKLAAPGIEIGFVKSELRNCYFPLILRPPNANTSTRISLVDLIPINSCDPEVFFF
jgi:hypothetical protein